MVYAEIGSNFSSQANAAYDDKVEYTEIQHTLIEEQHCLETGENQALKCLPQPTFPDAGTMLCA